MSGPHDDPRVTRARAISAALGAAGVTLLLSGAGPASPTPPRDRPTGSMPKMRRT